MMNRREALKSSGLLFGLTASSASIGLLLQSCQATPRVDWQPKFFSPEEAADVSAITDTMLPTSDTPGALDLKVDMFVDLMFAKSLSEADQDHVRKGYQNFANRTKEMFGRTFAELSNMERVKALDQLGEETNTFNIEVWGSPIGAQSPIDFYRRVRQLTLLGFYSSEEVAKGALG